MAAWPSSLPSAPVPGGYGEEPIPTIIRTDMELGPAKVRRRFTGNEIVFTLRYALTETQKFALEYFYHYTCLQGTLSFTWTHPITAASLTVYFLSPPTYVSNEQEYYGTIVIRGVV